MNRAERREKHICVDCNKPATRTQRCDECAAINVCRGRDTWRELAKARRASKAIRGECFDCKEPAQAGNRRCAAHLRVAVVEQAARRAAASVDKPEHRSGACACGNERMTGSEMCWCCLDWSKRKQAA